MNFVQACYFPRLWRIGAGYGHFWWILYRMVRLEIQRVGEVGCVYERINFFFFLTLPVVNRGFLSFTWYFLPIDVHEKTESPFHIL